MEALRLSFYGTGVAVSSDDRGVIEDLRRDFEYFAAASGACAVRVTLRLGAVPRERVPRGRASMCGSEYVAYDSGGMRIVDYHGRALAALDFRSETAEVFSEDAGLLRELGYLLICSRAGYQLDLRGLHRVHALGAARDGRGTLVLLPSGGGKSALCLGLLRERAGGLLSEDTPLVRRDGTLLPFPLRLGLDPSEDLSDVPEPMRRTMHRRQYGNKVLVDLAFFKEAVSGPVAPGLVVVGRRSGEGEARARRLWRAAAAPALFSSLVVGWGVPQLAEFMLRKDPAGLWGLARIAASRAAASIALLARCPAAELVLGADRRSNLDALTRLMDGN